MRSKSEIKEAIRIAQEEIRRLEEERTILDNKIRALRSVIAGYQAFLHGDPPEEHLGTSDPQTRQRLGRGEAEGYVKEALQARCRSARDIVDWVRREKGVMMTKPAVNSVLRRLLKRKDVVRHLDGYRLAAAEFAELPGPEESGTHGSEAKDDAGMEIADKS